MSGLEIAELPLQAGWLGICPLPRPQDDYAGDLTRLISWPPDMVLAQAGTEELARIGADAGTRADRLVAYADHQLRPTRCGGRGALALALRRTSGLVRARGDPLQGRLRPLWHDRAAG